jgi:tripartite-type tricarboxylate transporter receptor subunit TctC
MKPSRRKLLQFAAASSALPLLGRPGTALAQADYPNRDIRSICNLAPGSATDIITRFFADRLSKAVNRTVIVENKVGAAGAIGVEQVARSRPDGYTIFIGGGSSAMSAAPNLFKKLPYDPDKDFEHVTSLIKVGFAMVVDAKRPYQKLSDLTAHLRQKGDKANYGTSTYPGTVAAEVYKDVTKLPVLQINYKTTQEIQTDLASGEIDFAFVSFATARPGVEAGKMRVLAITPAQRMKVAGDWPTMTEQGIPLDLHDWWGVHVPAGTPKPIVDRLEAVFNRIVAEEDTAKFLANLGLEPFPGNQASVKQLVLTHRRAWAEHVKLAKIEPQ